MRPHYEQGAVTIYHGDCLNVLRDLEDASIDAVVTDPPYGLANTTPEQVADTLVRWVNGDRDYLPGGAGFMGKSWDAFVPPVAVWDECLRVLKPGGHLLAFAGSRTFDLMALGIRLAGFDVRDSIAWLYGSGFPKSLDVARAIDAHEKHGGSSSVQKRRAAMGHGYEPSETLGKFRKGFAASMNTPASRAPEQVGERTENAEAWEGWGTALKPAFEPIVVARKPLESTVAGNVLSHGTGALNIDACRLSTRVEGYRTNGSANAVYGDLSYTAGERWESDKGRWPSNVVLDESQAEELDRQSGYSRDGTAVNRNRGETRTVNVAGAPARVLHEDQGYGGGGGASRFFPTFRYEAKAPTSERPSYTKEGADFQSTSYGQMRKRECNVCGSRSNPAGGEHSGKPWPACGHEDWSWVEQEAASRDGKVQHPTVKPLDLMRWLVRLVTPPNGVILEPFAGSGTTVEAAVLEGFRCVAIEREADYLPLIEKRLSKPMQQSLFGDWDEDGAA